MQRDCQIQASSNRRRGLDLLSKVTANKFKEEKNPLNNKKLIPRQAQPINRITTGQLSSELAELSEEVLQGSFDGSNVIPAIKSWEGQNAGGQWGFAGFRACVEIPTCASDSWCSFEGEDAE